MKPTLAISGSSLFCIPEKVITYIMNFRIDALGTRVCKSLLLILFENDSDNNCHEMPPLHKEMAKAYF